MDSTVRDAAGIGVATGAYGLSFGALAISGGLSLPQTCALSLLMFTGASQFAFVGLLGSPAAIVTALLLGARNALYGLRLSSMVPRRAAHLVIDESAAMALVRGRRGFYATGLAVFVCWNAGTLLGALAGAALSDPRTLGLDAAAPAAFLALLGPRLREAKGIAALAAAAALVAVPLAPAGVPVLVAAGVATLAALAPRGEAAGAPRGEAAGVTVAPHPREHAAPPPRGHAAAPLATPARGEAAP